MRTFCFITHVCELRRQESFLRIALFLALIFLSINCAVTSKAFAQDDISWRVPGGEWSNAANWNDYSRRDSHGDPQHLVPRAVDYATINNGGLAEIASGAAARSLVIDQGSAVVITNGSLTLSAGGYPDGLTVGKYGSGILTQSSGTFSQTNGWAYLGFELGSGGEYDLSGGTINASGTGVYIAVLGSGVFRQTGGVNNWGSIWVGSGTVNYGFIGNGAYFLSGSNSQLFARTEIINGYYGNGSFTQSGGVNTVATDLQMNEWNRSASYLLTGGVLTAGREIIYRGTFTQSGGTNSVVGYDDVYPGSLLLGGSGNASYLLNGGNLNVQEERIFAGGLFRQTGGTHTVQQALYVTDGTVDLQGGTTYAADMQIKGRGSVINSSTLSLVSGWYVTANQPATQGVFTQTQNGVLDIRLNSGSPHYENYSYYGRIATDSAVLGGTLRVSLGAQYSNPSVGDAFLIVGASSVTGRFSNVILPPLPDRKTWKLAYDHPAGVMLTVERNDAAYIYVPINGQHTEFPAIFDPHSSLPVDPWIGASMAGLQSASANLNDIRHLNYRGDVKVSSVPGLWLNGTKAGFADIIASRALYVAAQYSTSLSATARALARATAGLLEDKGRASAGAASRQAGNEIAWNVSHAIDLARDSEPIPVFVDLVGYSRGGPVSTQVMRQLRNKSTPTQPIFFSLTLLDAIDPSGLSQHQLLEQAGDLLGDLKIPTSNWTTGRITNFYAEHAIIQGSILGSWFPPSVGPAIVNAIGGATDALLIPIGLPRGRSRVIPDGSRNYLLPGTTHASIPNVFAATAAGPYPHYWEPPSPTAYFANSTRIGELLCSPWKAIEDFMTPGCPNCDGPAPVLPTEYVTDPTFTKASAVITNVQAALTSPELAAIIPTDIDPIPGYLESIATDAWLVDDAWQRTTETATFSAAGLIIPSGESVWQDIDPASIQQKRLRVRVRGTGNPGASATVVVTGDGMQFTIPVTLGAIGTLYLDQVLVRDQQTGSGIPDRISVLGGSPLVVTQVSVGPGLATKTASTACPLAGGC